MPEILKIKPTRMELLKLKRRVKLAERGHKLLKEKQDALIMEFFTIYDEALSLRRELIKKMEEAFEALRRAQVDVGSLRLKEISIGVKPNEEIEIRTRNIMGVRVPLIEVPELKRKASDRGYAFISTTSTVDVAAEKFEEVLELAIRLAEVEESLKRLGKEIEKTKRRVNALEYIIIPRMKNTIKFIEQHLDEMERENFFRLKRVKAILEARQSM
ncbi:V-type ATP synthase subunit D [Pyrococcus abyssi]|uniref:A-type ATP synthase subunit D n=1 Tax=Pyrococcus abyssi (strain GE5 / Orsay) TaxID=272844 RepID=AATD_PYRAB|nr:V-type ATP synthase subunit D [Pyrococcus abyssi]Q9UXU9.1 RecName: Full=V-type ATP synthase subunit D; AltName: Full=V-ATPase subunit D [Pyrococcus abyssi GE5]CAB50664.1 atpD archaeal/vacuolar-type H+-transporting ATP synthase, subunit D [Pyrococcus abyssi GE5]CCE71233.1 TPA: V-type ATP synthase subunit D [Pyrococcus abyssi GE5]